MAKKASIKRSKRNDENFHPAKVIYKGKIYVTGNRYHSLIELYKTSFYRTVKMSEVEPLE